LKVFINHLFTILFHLGGFGLLALGVLDSSFLFTPFGNDVLVIAMTVRKHILMPYYAAMATVGSVIGCLILNFVCKKGGEQSLEKRVSRRRLDYVKRRFKKNAVWTLALASLMPPPFPFTLFVMVASALNYPRTKLLMTIGVARLIRFSIEGLLAICFGNGIFRLARSTKLEYAALVLVIVSVAGSGFSVYTWTRQSKATARRSPC
jgi:membrane protein YqaA with SNARE-associated domain